MSILNVDKIQPIGGGSTITVDATDIQATSATITASKFVGSGDLSVTGVSTFASDVSIADKIVHTGDTNTAIRFPAADTITAETGGSERLRITSAGRVGINQSSPDAMLQVDYNEGSSEIGLRLRAYNASGSKTWQLSEINGNAGVFTIRNATNAINALSIDSSGNIGQGSVTPTTPDGSNADNPNNGRVFTVYGDSPAINLIHNKAGGAGSDADEYSSINFGRNGSSTNPYRAVIGYKQVEDILHINSQNNIVFETGGNINTGERLRITSSGQVLIGINNAVDAEVDLQIHSATSGNGPILNLTNDTGDCRIFFGQDNSSGSANAQGQIRYNVQNNYLTAYTAGLERLRIQSDGTLVTGAQTVPTSSDIGNFYIKNASAIGSVSHQINYVSNAVFNSAWKYITTGVGATRIVVNQSGFQFDAAASGTAGNNITFNTGLNISSAGAHKITCTASYYATNLSEMNTGNLALNIIKSRQGQTKGIGFGAVGSSSSNTGIQAYDTSNNSANPLLINPFGGKVNIGCPDNGTANAKVNIEESTNNSTNTLKLINKPSGANGKARLEFYTETSSGQGCSPYIMSTSGSDAFGSNSANDGGLQFHTRHGGSGTDVNALEISNKGYVLQPARPYFKANLGGSTRITSTGYVTFSDVVYNNGGHYDNSDGKFYAPIAGLYWFSARINAYDRLDFRITVNGNEVERGQFNTDSDNVGWWSNTLTTVAEMTKNQYAQVYVSNLDQNTDPGIWCSFMGYLIS